MIMPLDKLSFSVLSARYLHVSGSSSTRLLWSRRYNLSFPVHNLGHVYPAGIGLVKGFYGGNCIRFTEFFSTFTSHLKDTKTP
jgi:hypothetical protein